jgi:hypothetical protein
MTRPNDSAIALDVPSDSWYWTSKKFPSSTIGLSRLSALESILASAIFLYIVFHYELYSLILVASFTVPFALLRSELSDNRASTMALRLIGKPPATIGLISGPTIHRIGIGISVMVFSFKVLAFSLLCRLISLITSLYRSFWDTISLIPNNWKRSCLSTDTFSRFEILPGRIGYPPYDDRGSIFPARARKQFIRIFLMFCGISAILPSCEYLYEFRRHSYIETLSLWYPKTLIWAMLFPMLVWFELSLF